MANHHLISKPLLTGIRMDNRTKFDKLLSICA